jgi:hypothetical protein
MYRKIRGATVFDSIDELEKSSLTLLRILRINAPRTILPKNVTYTDIPSLIRRINELDGNKGWKDTHTRTGVTKDMSRLFNSSKPPPNFPSPKIPSCLRDCCRPKDYFNESELKANSKHKKSKKSTRVFPMTKREKRKLRDDARLRENQGDEGIVGEDRDAEKVGQKRKRIYSTEL